jgi:hypothetical protein
MLPPSDSDSDSDSDAAAGDVPVGGQARTAGLLPPSSSEEDTSDDEGKSDVEGAMPKPKPEKRSLQPEAPRRSVLTYLDGFVASSS